MDYQVIFDKTLNHLRMQGRPSVGLDGHCRYRGSGGTSCAVGCHMADDHYSSLLENRSVEGGPVQHVLKLSGILIKDDSDVEFLRRLQLAHDSGLSLNLHYWEVMMKAISQDYSLTYSSP